MLRVQQSTKSKEYELSTLNSIHIPLNVDESDIIRENPDINQRILKTRNSIRKNMTIKIDNIDILSFPSQSNRAPKALVSKSIYLIYKIIDEDLYSKLNSSVLEKPLKKILKFNLNDKVLQKRSKRSSSSHRSRVANNVVYESIPGIDIFVKRNNRSIRTSF